MRICASLSESNNLVFKMEHFAVFSTVFCQLLVQPNKIYFGMPLAVTVLPVVPSLAALPLPLAACIV